MLTPDPAAALVLRETVRPEDSPAVRRIVQSTGFFNEEELDIAVELVDENLAKGATVSGYHFLFGELDGRPAGYVCHGPIAGTASSFDLYWIVVDDAYRGRGLGRRLMDAAEARIAAMGGRRVYVETSSREQYVPTRAFYEHCGYRVEAVLEDFYAAGDGKVILVKLVG